VCFISTTLVAEDASATMAREALSRPPLREKMEAVESLLKQYVLKLNPERGFAERTLTAIHKRGLELFAAESGYIRRTRQETLKDLDGMLVGVAFRIGLALENSTQGQTFLEDVVEGWSYRFISCAASFKESVLRRDKGLVCHEDESQVVYASIRENYDSYHETEISFYDPRTLDLQTTARLPNALEQFGRIRDTNVFFALMKGRGGAPDATNVLVLVDPVSRQMERLVVVNTVFKHGGEAAVLLQGRKLTVLVADSFFEDCLKLRPANPAFAGITVDYRKVKSGFTEEGFHASEAVLAKFSRTHEILLNKSALANRSLSFLGRDGDYPLLKRWKPDLEWPDRQFANGSETAVRMLGPEGNGFRNFHVVRTLRGGLLQDISLGDLTQKTIAVGAPTISQPGIFDSGVLYCVEGGSLVLAGEQGIRKLFKQKMTFSFDGERAYAIPERERDEGMKMAYFDVVDQEGRERRTNFSNFLRRIPSLTDFYPVPPHAVMVQSRTLQSQTADRFRLLSFEDGRLLAGPFFASSYVFNHCELLPGICRDGLRFYPIVTNIGPTNGRRTYEVRFLDEEKQISAEVDSPDQMPAFLDFRRQGDGSIRFLVVEAGVARIVDHDPKRGAQKKIREWRSSPRNAPSALYDEKSAILCVPADFGFEVHRIFTEEVSTKLFNIHLGLEGGYAVELPSGVFAGSPGCESLLRSRVSDGYLSGTAVAAWRNRPSEVLKALGGQEETIKILEKVTQRWTAKMGNPQSSAEPSVGDLPSVSLLQEVPLWAHGEEVQLKIQARAGAAGLKDLVVRVNGVRQSPVDGLPKEGDHSVGIRLAEGQNWIEMVAVDTLGRTSDPVRFRTILKRSNSPSQRYIVSMGVSKYRKQEMDLEFAAKDAREVAAALQATHSGKSQVLLLTDEEVQHGALSKVAEFLREVRESDEVIWFCAGHGFLDGKLEYRFAGHDFNVEAMDAGGISLDEMVSTLGESRSLRRLILLDTCHAGAVGEREQSVLTRGEAGVLAGVRAIRPRGMAIKSTSALQSGAQTRFIEEMFRLPGTFRGVNVIGASGGAEYALESGKWKNGVFTASLIEGIRDRKADADKDGAVNIGELREYLSRRVPELTGGAQKPSVVALEVDQDIDLRAPDLSRVPSSEGNASRVDKPLPSRLGEVGGAKTVEELVREYHRAIESQDERGVSACLAPRVDYYTAGSVPRSKVMADVRGDWNRYQRARFEVSDFREKSPTEVTYVLDYTLMEGARARRGKLSMTVRVGGEAGEGGILSIKAKVLSAK